MFSVGAGQMQTTRATATTPDQKKAPVQSTATLSFRPVLSVAARPLRAVAHGGWHATRITHLVTIFTRVPLRSVPTSSPSRRAEFYIRA